MLEARDRGVGDELLRAVGQIISGVWWRYGQRCDRDDFSQNCWVVFMKAVEQYDGESNAFCYLTSIFRREAAVLWRAEQRHAHEAIPCSLL